jgi:HSP20 family protein
MSMKTNVPAKTEETRPRRWDPFDWMSQMQAEMNRLWGDGWPSFRPLGRPAEMRGAWAPRADVYEEDGSLVVKADLPGIKREDIDVEVEDGDLVLRGERATEREIKEEDFYRMERFAGAFYRRLPLPEGAEPSKIDATYRDGVLEVHIPKSASKHPQPTRIPVR